MYIMQPLPPGMMYFINQDGAARILNRTRATIYNWINQKRLRGYSVVGQVLIPLVDVAMLMDLTEQQVYDIMIAHRLPIWQYYE